MIQWLLTIHITGIVFWMGTLLLLTRILAWHTQQNAEVGTALEQLERKLFFGGAIPGFVLTVGAGFWMLAVLHWGPLDAKVYGPAFHIKLTLVVVLTGLTFFIQSKMKSMADAQASLFKALHGVVAALFIAILIVFFVMYQAKVAG